TTNVTIVRNQAVAMFGRNQNNRIWLTNITKNVARLVIKSEIPAQNTRPTALPILASPTMLAATAAVTPASSWKSGASCEMIEIPAQVLRNKSSQRAHHCQVLSASLNVKLWPARCEVCLAVGVQPSGFQPSGGFCINNPLITVT